MAPVLRYILKQNMKVHLINIFLLSDDDRIIVKDEHSVNFLTWILYEDYETNFTIIFNHVFFLKVVCLKQM